MTLSLPRRWLYTTLCLAFGYSVLLTFSLIRDVPLVEDPAINLVLVVVPAAALSVGLGVAFICSYVERRAAELRHLIRLSRQADAELDTGQLVMLIEASDRDRELQLHAVQDAVVAVRAEAAEELRASMKWVFTTLRANGIEPSP